MMDNTRKRKIVRNFVIGYLLLQVLVIVLYLGFWAVHPGGFVVAENERTNIRQRQAEGIAAAKAKGIRFGRVPKPLPENFHAVYQRWKSGEITGTAAAKECGMPLSTFRYRAEIYEKAKLL